MTPHDALMRLEASVVRAAIAGLRRLGPVAASNLCGAIARTIGPFLPVSRVADANLRRALPTLDQSARRRVIRGVWDNLGRTVGELPHLPHLRRTASGPGWELAGEDILTGLAAQPGAKIFFSGHIGNWEIMPAAAREYGMPMSSMYRAASNAELDKIIVGLRQQAVGADVPMVPKGAAGAKLAFAILARGGALGILMDQKLNDGIVAQFFGRPAMTTPGLAILALRFRCPVVPGYVERIGPARFRLVCEAPLPLPDGNDRTANILALTQAVNDRLEAWIRARPESWLWLHRRWPKE